MCGSGGYNSSGGEVHRVVRTAQEILEYYRNVMRKFAAYSIRIVSLVPLAIGCGLTLVSARALRSADELEGCVSELKHETCEECREPEELVIPSPVLYEAFSILISHGKKSKEWIVALGAQELDGKLVITRVYDVNCAISTQRVPR